MKNEKYVVLFDGVTESGPYTEEQMRSLWHAGSVHEGIRLRKLSVQQFEDASDFRHEFEIRNQSPLAVFVILLALAGIVIAGLMGAWGFLALIGAKTAMQETVAAILLAGGLTAGCICILGIGIISKK